MNITCVVFDGDIPFSLNRRADRFETRDGWVIAEIEKGRIGLAHEDYGCLTVQGMPYVMFEETPEDVGRPLTLARDAKPEPESVTQTKRKR